MTRSLAPSNYSWSLRADPGQRLHLRFLDVSLRERTSDSALECADSVEVAERGKRLMRMCGESQTDIRLLSERNVLEVLWLHALREFKRQKAHSRFIHSLIQVSIKTATKTIFPRRGILAEFWPLGCASPRDQVSDGYLLWRNDTTAVLSCSTGFLFAPELQRKKVLRCVHGPLGPRWDKDVGRCVPSTHLR